MIIESLLDTDLYKFTMMQVVLHHFPAAEVEYRFKCRTPGVDLTPYIAQIEREITALFGTMARGDAACAQARNRSQVRRDQQRLLRARAWADPARNDGARISAGMPGRRPAPA